MLDILIKGGVIVDGSGAPQYSGDVAVRDGTIAAVGKIRAPAHRVIDADGALVTPGWVDGHTHYDGQVTWDDQLEGSAANGVTTVVMGNCGVGFAPVQPDGVQTLSEVGAVFPGSSSDRRRGNRSGSSDETGRTFHGGEHA